MRCIYTAAGRMYTGMQRKFGITSVDADLVFAKVKTKGEKTIDFHQFLEATHALAQRRGVNYDTMVAHIINSRGPRVSGNVTKAETVRFHDDPTMYTGVHAVTN